METYIVKVGDLCYIKPKECYWLCIQEGISTDGRLLHPGRTSQIKHPSFIEAMCGFNTCPSSDGDFSIGDIRIGYDNILNIWDDEVKKFTPEEFRFVSHLDNDIMEKFTEKCFGKSKRFSMERKASVS